MSSAEQLYKSLVEPIEERMMRTVARLVRDPDESADVFQNVLMIIWKDLKKINEHPNPHGYILRACVSASYDCLRKRTRRKRHTTSMEDSEINVPHPVKDPEVMARETQRIVLDAIAKLPRQQAQAVMMQVIQDEGFVDIAKALGCSEATARSHVSKGKAKLRDILVALNPRPRKGGSGE